jgi:hypothetical protein
MVHGSWCIALILGILAFVVKPVVIKEGRRGTAFAARNAYPEAL